MPLRALVPRLAANTRLQRLSPKADEAEIIRIVTGGPRGRFYMEGEGDDLAVGATGPRSWAAVAVEPEQEGPPAR